jgi:hypothetical protein
MSRIWVLVAESSRAKLFSAENRKAPLVEIGDFAHPEARLHEGDLVSDQSGSDGGSVGQGRHVLDNKTNRASVFPGVWWSSESLLPCLDSN